MKSIAFLIILLFTVLLTSAQTLQSVTNSGASTTNTLTLNNPAGLQVIGSYGSPAYMIIDQLANSGGKKWRVGHTGAALGFGSFDIYNITDNITPFSISSGGNIGIGTTNPNVALHVAKTGNNVVGDMTLVATMTDPTGIKGISLGYNQTSQAGIIYSENNTGVGSPLEFWTYNGSSFGPRMIFSQAGNLGIGTANTQGYKLAVAGNMIAESVKVKLQSAWPDYVFAKGYQLPSLQFTEKHIKDKGHLPGIPSASEVQKNGVNLGEMNAKLLEKIEELTLYLIEQNKRSMIQEQKIETLQKQVKKLKDEK